MTKVTIDFGPFTKAMADVAQQIEALARAAAQASHSWAEYLYRSFPRRWVMGMPPPHAFTPNYDLACSVCGLGPEDGHQ